MLCSYRSFRALNVIYQKNGTYSNANIAFIEHCWQRFATSASKIFELVKLTTICWHVVHNNIYKYLVMQFIADASNTSLK